MSDTQAPDEETGEWPLAKAVNAVHVYLQEIALEKTDPQPDYEIFVVWFNYTLGNWKALVSTSLPDGRYYEVTHNAEKFETYLDVYVKVWNGTKVG